MNTDDLRVLLAEHAAEVDDLPVDRVGVVHRRVHAVRRNRLLGAVAAALVLVAGAGFAAGLPGADEDSQGPVAPPDQGLTDPLDQYRVVPESRAETPTPLKPGTWIVEGVGPATMPRVALDIPRGWSGSGSIVSATGEPLRSVGYWSPTHVIEDPCGSNDTTGLTPVRSVEELADALAAQGQSHTTAPVPVSIGGYQGVSLELRPDVATRTCTDTVFYIFRTYAGDRWLHEVGEVDRYWILDVEGEVLVLNAAVQPGVTKRQHAQLVRVVESAEFDVD